MLHEGRLDRLGQLRSVYSIVYSIAMDDLREFFFLAGWNMASVFPEI